MAARGSRDEEGRGCAIGVQADVSSETDVVRLFENRRKVSWAACTAMVNNAATLEPQRVSIRGTRRGVHRVPPPTWRRPFLCAREAVRRCRHDMGEGGAIVNVFRGGGAMGIAASTSGLTPRGRAAIER